ncbi:hypothetical protein HPB47_028512 [Ixodes persulcatus]|uniref:Uncharacterized protein n=1 Tax=Ixodes persulcatus TaxID=34615 RepID=A0AC60PT17_IXOPE|nr:hypothetical protein HPB47_028512 [Ixodes persulcatus]
MHQVEGSGGLCDKLKWRTSKEGLVKMALNTGVITFLNHRRQVPTGVSEVTFAHEMGHNFGSEHDVGPQCIPGGSEGNYLMFSSASSGSEPNNRKFSPCSVDFISAILHDMLSNQGSRENCLIESGGSICGNTIREGDEECDCGFTEDECRNKCCFSPSNPHKAKGCTLTPNVICRKFLHPPLITRDVTFDVTRVTSDVTMAMREEEEVCLGGDCQGSICLQFGFVGCQGTGKDYTPQQMCLIHCRANGPASRSPSNSVLNSVPQASETVCRQLYWSRSLSMELVPKQLEDGPSKSSSLESLDSGDPIDFSPIFQSIDPGVFVELLTRAKSGEDGDHPHCLSVQHL